MEGKRPLVHEAFKDKRNGEIIMELQELKDITKSFKKELEDANNGKETSLPFIVHDTPEFSIVNDGEVFQVIVVGGTYGISAKVEKEGNSCKLLSQKKVRLPKLSNEEDFLLFLEHVIDPDARVLVLNFAFPIIPVFENGRLDGKLLRGTKGHTFRGMVGKKIGRVVEKFIYEKMEKKIIVSVANDTVCLLMSGLEKATYKNLGAGIVGTGMNFAFYLDKNELVNLESADFNKFESSQTGIVIDEESANPGRSHYEKEVAGVYLFKHFNLMLRTEKIAYPSVASTEELDLLARKDTKIVSDLARSLFKRSAELISCQIAAIMEYRKTDMVFVMEGSLFWKGYRYKETVVKNLKELTKYKATFVEIKDSGVIGAAHLVM